MKAMPVQLPNLLCRYAHSVRSIRGKLDEAVVGDQPRKLPLEIDAYVLLIIALEVMVAGLVEVDHDRHDLAGR